MDSELDASKTFEVSEHLRMCDACRVRFDRESTIDQAMRNSIRLGKMPQALWSKIQSELASVPSESTSKKAISHSRQRSVFGWFRHLALAAVVALVVTWAVWPRDEVSVGSTDRGIAASGANASDDSIAHMLELAAPELKKFQPIAEGEGTALPEHDLNVAMQTRLAEITQRVLGAEVQIQKSEKSHHGIKLVGVYERTDDAGNPFVELRLNCCGQPTIVALAAGENVSRIAELANLTGGDAIKYDSRNMPDVTIEVQSRSIDGVAVAGATARHYLTAVFDSIKVVKT